MRHIVVMAFCLASSVFAGCSANHHSIYRSRTLDAVAAQVVTIDAKQRAILTMPPVSTQTTTTTTTTLADGSANVVSTTALSEAGRRFCSEPSPDVYAVIAQALSAGGSFGQTADPASLEAALNLAFGSSEQGASIPRTQTVNMLRELMFRTCERYLSGGYDDMELSVQAVRDQRLMVSVLAIEQLTGAVTPRSVVIGATASGSAGATGEAIVRLDDARKARDKAVADYRSAQSAYDAANGEAKVCDAIAGKPEASLSDEQKAKVKPCADARTARTATLAEQTAKTAAYEELSMLARAGGVSVNASLSSTATGGLDRVDPPSVTDVSAAVSSIVARNFSDNTEVMLFCLRVLRPGPAAIAPASAAEGDGVKSVCTEYIEREIRAAGLVATANAANLVAELDQSRGAELSEKERAFPVFWTAKSAEFADVSKRSAFVTSLKARLSTSRQGLADCFGDKATEAEVRGCFMALPLTNIRELIR